MLKLPSVFRGHDQLLHTAFYFCAAAFLNILFAKRNLLIHAVIFGGLYLFGMAIEHGQVLSKKWWQIPHGRYDPADVQSNLKGLLIFSIVWLVYFALSHLTKKKETTSHINSQNLIEEELIYEDDGYYFLLDYAPAHSEIVIRSRNKSNADNIYNIDLFFKAVDSIQLPTKMNGIKIYKIARKQSPCKMNLYNRNAIYRIDSNNGGSAFIDASVFVVFHNQLDITVTSLGDFTWSNSNKEIFSTTTAST